ncbi:DUF4382 domain-containing protein [Bdellovibrio sp. SKB1291214]|uniref:DUF4382 domain-containing protein n=1 Tax=Bdellovibrio sp. SKB1291214 TaxID=1732569 RepID=UPI000B516D39|nr:DUF4382 domain-containing protein [Bdellovibrio sp. SKB1291214]UYL07526.1 DUF4382 domain-containing protein [Bdellovibrio sp. SKB1291214]
MSNFLSKITVTAGMVFVGACSPQSVSNSASVGSSSLSVDASKQAAVSFKLVDAPNKEIKSVVVDIDHLEVLVAGASKSGRLQLAKGLGPVDLLKLQNGVSLPLQDIVAPDGLQIQQIRLILKDSGHYIVKEDDSICELKTPSAQKTGVKIILTNKVQFEAGHQYNVTVDFDANKSVVLQGNGGCLLKPVLKLISVTKQELPEVIDPQPTVSPSPSASPSPAVSPSPSPEPPVEIITTPDENDSSGDGWDYTPIVDGQEPIVDESQLSEL